MPSQIKFYPILSYIIMQFLGWSKYWWTSVEVFWPSLPSYTPSGKWLRNTHGKTTSNWCRTVQTEINGHFWRRVFWKRGRKLPGRDEFHVEGHMEAIYFGDWGYNCNNLCLFGIRMVTSSEEIWFMAWQTRILSSNCLIWAAHFYMSFNRPVRDIMCPMGGSGDLYIIFSDKGFNS